LSDGEIPLGCRQETEGADNSLVSVEAIVEINLLERRQLESVNRAACLSRRNLVISGIRERVSKVQRSERGRV
jgi:hypothetical protein